MRNYKYIKEKRSNSVAKLPAQNYSYNQQIRQKKGQRVQLPPPIQRIQIPNSLKNTGITVLKPSLTSRSEYNRRKHSHNFKYMTVKRNMRNMEKNQRLKKLNRTYSNFTKNQATHITQSQALQSTQEGTFQNVNKSTTRLDMNTNTHEISDFYLTTKQNLYQKRQQNSMSQYSMMIENELLKDPKYNWIHTQSQKTSQKFYQNLSVELREFYESKSDFRSLFKEFDVATFCLSEVSEKVKCYRFQLGNVIMKVGNLFHSIFEKSLHTNLKLIKSFRDKVEAKLNNNIKGFEQLEIEKNAYMQQNKQLKSVLELQNSEVKIFKLNIEGLENEIQLLRELLKKDVDLAEKKKEKEFNQKLGILTTGNSQDAIYDPAEQMEENLGTLRGLIKSLETEQDEKKSLMGGMGSLLKEMLRGSKRTIATQVDEAQLAWSPELIIFPGNPSQTTEDSSSVNIGKVQQKKQVYDNMEILDQQAKNIQKKSAKDKNKKSDIDAYMHPDGDEKWSLPPSLIVFLENTTKKRETARVVPWKYFKNVIYEIYQNRINQAWEINGSLINTFIPFDEFLIMHFLEKYKLRRIAEIKLFEFLVSLKYFQREYSRAKVFSHLCNISKLPKFQNDFTHNEGQDIYLQYYFLFVFKSLMDFQEFIFVQPFGLSLIEREKIDEVARKILVFYEEPDLRKFIAKAMKIKFTKVEDIERVDCDKLISMLLSEYYDKRKAIQGQILKCLTKNNSKNSGVYSTKDLEKMLANDILNRTSTIQFYKYPNKLTLTRALLHALTSGQNKFTLHNKYFMASCTRFGLDCPFPFVFTRSPFLVDGKLSIVPSTNKGEPQIVTIQQEAPIVKLPTMKSLKKIKSRDSLSKEASENKEKSKEDVEISDVDQNDDDIQTQDDSYNVAINASSALFAQHFSILRELRNYCLQFKESVKKKDHDTATVYRNFDNIINILDTGCQFLNFPVHA